MAGIAKPLVFLAALLLFVLLYSVLAASLGPMLGLSAELDYYIVNKWLLALILMSVVLGMGLRRATGLVVRINWRTLPLYWPMAVILGLLWMGADGLPAGDVFLKIVVFCLAVGISEELMFRGLVFHWFRELPPRGVVLISAAAFGSVHLVGLASEIHPAAILAQAYFAFALGLIFAGARARDVSIMLPILAHAVFDIIALSATGGVAQTFENVPQAVGGMLFAGSIALGWGLYLLWKLGGNDSGVYADGHPASAA